MTNQGQPIEEQSKILLARYTDCPSVIAHERTGQDTATVRAYLIAVHMFPDERVFFATGKYVDAVECVNGQWKIVHRDEPITSCALLEAFPVG